MRITHFSQRRNYLRNLNQNASRLDYLAKQVYTGQKFFKASQAPANATRILQNRRSIMRIDSYIENAKNQNIRFAAIEKTLLQLSEVSKSVSSRYISGINGTNSMESRQAIAKELSAYKEDIISLTNNTYAGKYIFGGTNDSVKPLDFDKSGRLVYNGHVVEDIDPSSQILEDENYIEIGLGIKMSQNSGVVQKVEQSSAINNSFTALQALGSGKENIVLILDDMIDTLNGTKNVTPNEMGNLLDRFYKAENNISNTITRIGSSTKYLNYSINRLEDNKLSLIQRGQSLQIKDPAKAITDLKMQEYVYNASLKMGQSLIQSTLFDYIK